MVTEAETETEINEVITANLNKGSLFNNLPEIDTTDIMVSNIQEPVYQYPTPPTLELPDSPTPPTSYVPPAFPTSPDLAIPDPPELAELTNLVIPNCNFVPYDASCPELDLSLIHISEPTRPY